MGLSIISSRIKSSVCAVGEQSPELLADNKLIKNKGVNMETKIEDIIIRDEIYPRDYTNPELIQKYAIDIEKLPAIEINQHNELIDGMHRITAHRQEGMEHIETFVTETVSDDQLLKLACKRNAIHGYQLITSDKQRMTRRFYQGASNKNRPALKKALFAFSIGHSKAQLR